MSRGAVFWNLMASRYSRAAIADQASYEKKLAITRKYLNPDSEVLELGCGTGATALLHAPHVKSLLATDYSHKMIAIARQRLETDPHDNVRFEVADFASLADSGRRFDAVLALNVLHLLPNLEKTLADCYRLLKPGGYLISSTGCLAGKYRMVRGLFAVLGVFGGLPKLQAFSEQALLDSHVLTGFTVVETFKPEPESVSVFCVAQKATAD